MISYEYKIVVTLIITRRKTMEKEINRVNFNTTIQKDILDNFREYCKKKRAPMNQLIEIFMQKCIDGEINFSSGISFR